MVAEKTDGDRYILVISKFANKKPYAVLVNRAFTMYQVQIFAPKSIYDGSVFDGELVWNDQHHCLFFLIFDIMMVDGQSVVRDNFTKRYQIINRLFMSQDDYTPEEAKTEYALQLAEDNKIVVIPDNDQPLFFYSKPCVSFEVFGSLRRSVNKLKHASDGFIFTPINQPVARNTNYHMFKWKYEPTIDLCIEQKNQQLAVSCKQGAKLILLEDAFPELSFEYHLPPAVQLESNETFIVEANVKIAKETVIQCIFYRFRRDKTSPNHCKVIQNVLEELKENITLDELEQLSDPRRNVIESSM